MNANPQVPSGDNPPISDPGVNNPTDPDQQSNPNPVDAGNDSDQQTKDTVSYETHRKLLGEKKALQEKVKKFEEESKLKLETELKQKEDWKKLAELKAKEAEEAMSKLTSHERNLMDSKKLTSVLDVLGPVEKKYWNLIDIDQVLVNPDTGDVDPMSVTKYAEGFKKQYFEIIQPGGQSRLPSEAPSVGGSITYEEWLKLPVDQMKAKKSQVINQE